MSDIRETLKQRKREIAGELNRISRLQDEQARIEELLNFYDGDGDDQEEEAPAPIENLPFEIEKKERTGRGSWGKSDAEKKQIVDEITASIARGANKIDACNRHGISDQTYRNWKKKLNGSIPAPVTEEPVSRGSRNVAEPSINARSFNPEDAPHKPWNEKEAGVKYLELHDNPIQ